MFSWAMLRSQDVSWQTGDGHKAGSRRIPDAAAVLRLHHPLRHVRIVLNTYFLFTSNLRRCKIICNNFWFDSTEFCLSFWTYVVYFSVFWMTWRCTSSSIPSSCRTLCRCPAFSTSFSTRLSWAICLVSNQFFNFIKTYLVQRRMLFIRTILTTNQEKICSYGTWFKCSCNS